MHQPKLGRKNITAIKIKSANWPSGGQTGNLEIALCNLEQNEPVRPLIPRLLYGDATPEALSKNLAKNWPSGGIVCAEAGAVLGAHGMGRDSIMRNLALLNILWDGGELVIDRKSDDSIVLRDTRLSVALQIQEATLHIFLEKAGYLARGTGFLARFLIAQPESTQGSRFYTKAPESWPALKKFNSRIAEILTHPVSINDEGGLNPLILPFSPDAKSAWIVFHDAIESELVTGGELYDIRDVASKVADNAARLAALFHIFAGNSGGTIGLEVFESASRIVAWHLHEARRFFSELALPAELANAIKLDKWLIRYCCQNRVNSISRRDLQRLAPQNLRKPEIFKNTLFELVGAGRIREQGKRILVNPALIKEVGS